MGLPIIIIMQCTVIFALAVCERVRGAGRETLGRKGGGNVLQLQCCCSVASYQYQRVSEQLPSVSMRLSNHKAQQY